MAGGETATEQANLTVGEKYRRAVRAFRLLFELESGRKDSGVYQAKLAALIKDFTTIQGIIDRLGLFSDNETLEEVSTNYLPFINVKYYLAALFMNYLLDQKATYAIDSASDKLRFKSNNLDRSKSLLLHYLVELDTLGNVLLESQTLRLNSFSELYSPTFNELVSYNSNPALKRAEKIANYKLEKELNGKLALLDGYYKAGLEDDEEALLLKRFDEEVVRAIYADQLKLFSLHSFNNLELVMMEADVLSKRPLTPLDPPTGNTTGKDEKSDDHGYTTRLETLPFKEKKFQDLISKHGKVLQPFTITSTKQDLQKKVFGTGQVLPSMSVEEYLDYELANGKMLKEEVKDTAQEENEDIYNSDEEYEKRAWDDWKDDNPKGSGNTTGNLG